MNINKQTAKLLNAFIIIAFWLDNVKQNGTCDDHMPCISAFNRDVKWSNIRIDCMLVNIILRHFIKYIYR